MMEETWTWNPVVPTGYVIFFTLVACGFAGWVTWLSTQRLSLAKRCVLIGLRWGFIGGVALLGLNPGIWKMREEVQHGKWVTLMDVSQSMSELDGGLAGGETTASRWNEALDIYQELSEHFEKSQEGVREADEVPELYTFSEKLQKLSVTDAGDAQKKLKALALSGETRLEASGVSLLSRVRSGALRARGVFLISDGKEINRKKETLGLQARALGVPVFSIPVGGVVKKKDLSLQALKQQRIGYPGQEVRLRAYLENHGLGRISPEVSLKNSDGMILEKKEVVFEEDGRQLVEFLVTPEREGSYEYTMEVEPLSDEVTEVNNHSVMTVLAREHKTQIFFAEGRPFWDSKFLVQLFRKQPNVQLRSVHRITDQKYFQVDEEEEKTQELHFPQTQEEMNVFDLMILGKGVEYFLDEKRINLLKHFVKERGGCIVFARGKPYGGEFPELEDLEPVIWGEPLTSPFRLFPTEEGENSLMFSGILEGLDSPVWREMHPLKSATRVDRVKSFSTVMVEGMIESGGRNQRFPAVVSRRYGKGVVILINADGLWEWDFFPSVAESKELYQEFWTQLAQWAATFADFLPGQSYALRLSHGVIQQGEPIRAQVMWRGEGASQASPRISVWHGDAMVQQMIPQSSPNQSGRWDALFTPERPGRYRFKLEFEEAEVVHDVSTVLQVMPPLSEMEETSADIPYLRRLAESSGGRLLKKDDVATFFEGVTKEEKETELKEAEWESLWNRWWVCSALVLLLLVEWGIRRREGLQ